MAAPKSTFGSRSQPSGLMDGQLCREATLFPALTDCQTGPGEHFGHHRVLTVNPCEVSLTILLHSQPLRRFVLGQAIKSDAIDANYKRQEREQKSNRGFPAPVNGAILKRYSTLIHLVRRHSRADINHLGYRNKVCAQRG